MNTRDLRNDLVTVEAQLVDWKRREREYRDAGLTVPQHVTRRIEQLKKDAQLLRRQTEGMHR